MIIDQPFRLVNGEIHSTEEIESMIPQIIMTKSSVEGHIGELAWNTDFGSGVYLMRHNASIRANIDIIIYYIKQALKKYLKTIQIVSIKAVEKQNDKGTEIYVIVKWAFQGVYKETSVKISKE